MGTVRAHMSMSLDGYAAGPNVSLEHPMGVGGERLHQWLFDANRDPKDAEVAAEMFAPQAVGAVVMGRRTFDVGVGLWGDDGAFRMPCFVMTHRAADRLVKGPTSFTFVTNGVRSALAQAQAAAGERAVNIMGAETVRAFLHDGLLDEIQINLVPVTLSGGARLLEPLGRTGVEFERIRIVESPSATHLTFRVL